MRGQRRIRWGAGLLCAVAMVLLVLTGCAPEQAVQTLPSALAAQPEEVELVEHPAEPDEEPVAELVTEPTPRNTEYRAGYIQGHNGFFQPDSTITRAEIAQIFYNLALSETGDRTFSDVKFGSWYYDAVMALSGALTGYDDGTFRPQQTATVAEFLTLVCRVMDISLPEREEGQRWYQPVWDTALQLGWLEACPAAEPNAALHRDEAVTILNRALDRHPDEDAIDTLSTPVFLDVDASHQAYYDILEAAVGHEVDLDEGVWIAETLTPPLLSPGIHALNGLAYYVQEDGTIYRQPGLLETAEGSYLVADTTGRVYADGALHTWGSELVYATKSGALLTNDTWHDFTFDSRGFYSLADAELAGHIDQALAACTDATMTQSEKLRACFDYVRSFSYLGRNSAISVQTMSPEQAATYAKKIFETGKGDCYNFTAAFYYLARALGYDATAVVGTCSYVWSSHAIAHGWVTIPIDGTTWLFDPQIENYNNRSGLSNDVYGAYQVTYETASATYYPN